MALYDLSGAVVYATVPTLVGLESMGLPLPGEAALISAAALASRGDLSLALIIGLAATGAIVGDNIGFLLGRKFGPDLLLRAGPFQSWRRSVLQRGRSYFEHRGGRAVFLGRWVSIGRVAIAWLAGADRMRWASFAAANAAGSIAWALSVGVVAYTVGSAGAAWIGLGATALALAAVVPVILRRRRRVQAP